MSFMGVRQYARHRGLSQGAVQQAIKNQRIVTSVHRDKDGRAVIDSDKADIEWPVGPREIDSKAKRELAQKALEKSVDDTQTDLEDFLNGDSIEEEEEIEGDDPGDEFSERKQDQSGIDLARARANKEQYAAKAAQIKYEKEIGIVVDAEEVEKRWVAIATIVRTKILALPSKIRGRMPEITPAQYHMIEKLVRESLQELADHAP